MSIEVKKFVTAFEKTIQQHIFTESMKLGKGQAPNMEEYKRTVGKIAGLEAAVGLAKDMRNQMDMDDDQQGVG